MSYTEALIRNLCQTLWQTVTRNTAQDWRFAQWLQMPLPRNEYWDVVRATAAAADSGTTGAASRKGDAGGNKRKHAPTPVATPSGRIRVIESADLASRNWQQPSVPITAGSGNGMRMASIDVGARVVMTSVDASLADERAMALRAIEDSTNKHFDYSRPGVIPKITQLLLVLALEPCRLSLEFVLRRRFDNDFVARNFLATDTAVPAGDAGAWHRDVKRMAFNLFERFPELALSCDTGSDVTQLRAVQHLWCLADAVFGKCTATLHSETATQFTFNRILNELAHDRTPLLEAVARANIYAAGTDPGRFLLRRDLFVEALVCAQLHILQLHSHATTNSDTAARLRRALDSLKATRATVAQYT